MHSFLCPVVRACDGWRVTRLVIALAALSTACASTPAAPTRVQCEQPARQEHRLAAEYVIATFDGGKLTYGDLSNGNSGAFRKLQNEYLKSLFMAERKAIDLFLAQKLVDRAAKTASTTPDAYLAKIAGESPQIDDAEVTLFYQENAARLEQPLEVLKEQLRAYLARQAQGKRVSDEIERLREDAHVQVTLPEPAWIPSTFDLAGRPRKGKVGAKVTIVEFSDFQCPYCKQAGEQIEAVLAAYPDDVELYFFQYPLDFHASAKPAATAALCAHAQGKFWAYHDRMFDAQDKLGLSLFRSTAKDLGLDMKAFSSCLLGESAVATVEADVAQGKQAGVSGTPTFFINGVPYPDGVPTVEAIAPYLTK